MPNLVEIDRDEIRCFKQMLIQKVRDEGNHRARKAVFFPNSAEENLTACGDLAALAKSLEELPEGDPLWHSYTSAAGDEATLLLISDRESEELSSIGSQRPTPDSRLFLRDLLQGTKQEAL